MLVNPDDVVHEFGADTLRLYEMFIGDFEKAARVEYHQRKRLPAFCRAVLEPAEFAD